MKEALKAVYVWIKAAVLNLLAGAGSKRLVMVVIVAAGIIKVLKADANVAAVCATVLATAYIVSEALIKRK